jgi:AraC-like DNA-binding protein
LAALLGAIQGLFLTVILATQRRNRTANRILAVAMLAFSLYLLSAVYHAVGFERVFPHFFGVAYPMPLLFGPVIYLYAVHAADRTRRLTWRDAWHFAPFAAAVLAVLPVYLMSGAEKIAFYEDLKRGVVPPTVVVIDPLKYLSGIAYTTATIVFLRRHSRRVRDSYSSLERVNLQWVVRLALASAAIWALATAVGVIHPDGALARRGEDVIALAIAVLVYGIGYMALRQPEIINFVTQEFAIPVDALHAAAAPAPTHTPAVETPPEPAAPRYERSGLSEREAALLKQALLKTMESDRPYANSGLTLAELADRLNTTPHKLSEVLNAQLGQTFYDFINAYRVQDVQRRIADEKYRNLTILSLALDAGFASKATFNHVFRKHTGRTPSAYRRSLAP